VESCYFFEEVGKRSCRLPFLIDERAGEEDEEKFIGRKEKLRLLCIYLSLLRRRGKEILTPSQSSNDEKKGLAWGERNSKHFLSRRPPSRRRGLAFSRGSEKKNGSGGRAPDPVQPVVFPCTGRRKKRGGGGSAVRAIYCVWGKGF